MELTDLPSRFIRRVDSAHAHLQLVREFERVMLDAPAAGAAGPVIGFATFGSGGWHFVLEALLAHALQLRGARPTMLICDMPELPVCDERTIESRQPDRCAGCFHDKRDLIAASRLPWIGLRSLVPAEAIAQAEAMAAAVAAGAIEDFAFRGWPIGRWLHVSASHFLRADARGDAADKVAARRKQLATAMVAVTAVERWLDEVKPQVVIAESGAHLVWRVAFELARARGIPVICREMGKGGWDCHLYALNRDAMAPDLSDEWARVKNDPLTAAEGAAVDAYLDDLPAHTYVGAARSRDRRTDLRATLGIGAGPRVAVAFTNVTWDLATAGRDAGFSGVLDWIGESIGAAARNPSMHLVVRVHPAEASVRTRERLVEQIAVRWPTLPANITVLGPESPTSAADLCELADLVLAYNSTAGVEAAMRGRPVIVAGVPHYGGKGFTRDASSRSEYRSWLETWARGAVIEAPAAPVDLARRYFHLFFLRYQVRLGWTTSPLEPPFELIVRSIDELRPGRNAVLDLVCDGILDCQQIMMPRAAVPACAP